MKKRLVGLLVAVMAFGAFVAPAMASTKTNIAATIKKFENGAAYNIVINGNPTGSSGYFSGLFCSSVFVEGGQTIYYSEPLHFIVGTSTYQNNGNVVHMMNVTVGAPC